MDGLILKDENYKVHLVDGPNIKLIYLSNPQVNGLLEEDNYKIPIADEFNVKLTLLIYQRTNPSKRWFYLITNYMFKAIKVDE